MCSMFSSKCDCADCYLGIPESEERSLYEIQHTDFYVDDKLREINSVRDLVPFFPCIPGMSTWSGGKDGSGSCWFSSRSYVRRDDDERMQYKFAEARKAYRRLKRNKEKITPESVYDGWYHWSAYEKDENDRVPVDWEISKAVAYDGQDAYIGADILNSSLSRHERKMLFDTMIEYGYTQDQAIGWVYEGDINALEDGYSLK